jgi:hypothetical protein
VLKCAAAATAALAGVGTVQALAGKAAAEDTSNSCDHVGYINSN